jgi:hypothetical protein
MGQHTLLEHREHLAPLDTRRGNPNRRFDMNATSISLAQAMLLQGLLLSVEGQDMLKHANEDREAMTAANAAVPYVHDAYRSAETSLKSRLRYMTGSKALAERIFDRTLDNFSTVTEAVESVVRYDR